MKNYILTDNEYKDLVANLKSDEKTVTCRKIRSQAKDALPVIVKDLVLLCLFVQKTTPTLSLRRLIQEAQVEVQEEIQSA